MRATTRVSRRLSPTGATLIALSTAFFLVAAASAQQPRGVSCSVITATNCMGATGLPVELLDFEVDGGDDGMTGFGGSETDDAEGTSEGSD